MGRKAVICECSSNGTFLIDDCRKMGLDPVVVYPPIPDEETSLIGEIRRSSEAKIGGSAEIIRKSGMDEVADMLSGCDVACVMAGSEYGVPFADMLSRRLGLPGNDPSTTADRTEKLQMRGENITVETIGKTVTDGFEKTAHADDVVHTRDEAERPLLQRAADVFVLVVGILLKVFAVLVGIVMLPVLLLIFFVLMVVLVSLVLGSSSFLYYLSPFGMDWFNNSVSTGMAVFGSIGTLLMIGIPVAALAYWVCSQLFHWQRPFPTGAKWVLVVLWVLSVVVCAIYFLNSGHLFWGENGPEWFWNTVGHAVRITF